MPDTELKLLPVEVLIPTPDNPRVMREDAAFTELVKSIESAGIRQPLIARPMSAEMQKVMTRRPNLLRPKVGRDTPLFDLRAGHRRLAAAIKAGLTRVLVIVSEMDDREAMEATVSENLHRENLHPIEESRAIQGLLDVGWEISVIADRLGKAPAWVARRAKLRELSEAWQKETADPEAPLSVWPATLLDRIARLPNDTQDEILEEVQEGTLDYIVDKPAPTAAELDRYIAANWLKTLGGAPWKLNDATLLPEAGACDACQKRSGHDPLLFDVLEEVVLDGKKGHKARKRTVQDRCLDQGCYERKRAAYTRRRAVELTAKYDNLAFVAPELNCGGADKELKDYPGVLGGHGYYKVKKSEAGAVPALVVNGSAAGELCWIHRDSHTATTGRKEAVKKSTGNSQPAATPLKERRKLLDLRRKTHAVKAVQEILRNPQDTDQRLWKPFPPRQAPWKNPDKAAAMAVAFGTDKRHEHRGMYVEFRDGKKWIISPWDEFDRALSQPDELATALAAAVLPVLADRLEIFKTSDAADAYPEAQRICKLLNLNLATLDAVAAKAIPEPKSWASLKADGMPKGTRGHQGNEATRQRGNKATRQQGSEATRHQGTKATRPWYEETRSPQAKEYGEAMTTKTTDRGATRTHVFQLAHLSDDAAYLLRTARSVPVVGIRRRLAPGSPCFTELEQVAMKTFLGRQGFLCDRDYRFELTPGQHRLPGLRV